MEWWMVLVMGLTSPAMPAAAMLSPEQDGLTLEPVVVTSAQVSMDRPAGLVIPEQLESPAVMSLLEQPLDLDAVAGRPVRSGSDDRSGFIYEPIYSTTSDRIQYQTGSGLGVGVTTVASVAISQSVRLRRGLDVSLYYAHPVDIVPHDALLETSGDLRATTPAPSAGVRLEWKF